MIDERSATAIAMDCFESQWDLHNWWRSPHAEAYAPFWRDMNGWEVTAPAVDMDKAVILPNVAATDGGTYYATEDMVMVAAELAAADDVIDLRVDELDAPTGMLWLPPGAITVETDDLDGYQATDITAFGWSTVGVTHGTTPDADGRIKFEAGLLPDEAIGDHFRVWLLVYCDNDLVRIQPDPSRWPNRGRTQLMDMWNPQPGDVERENYDDEAIFNLYGTATHLISMLAETADWYETDRPHLPRAVQRKAKRRFDEVRDLTVIKLRRRAYQRDNDGDGDAADREYTHRWIRRGHWRSLDYLEEGRRTWVRASVCGPENKPLIVKDRLGLLVR